MKKENKVLRMKKGVDMLTMKDKYWEMSDACSGAEMEFERISDKKGEAILKKIREALKEMSDHVGGIDGVGIH